MNLLAFCFLLSALPFVNYCEGFFSYNFFRDYPNFHYVETGSSGGGSIARALDAQCFRFVHSIDLDPHSIEVCRKQFEWQRRVFIYEGDSGTELWRIIEKIATPITFFLDAHRYPPVRDGMKNTPLLEEIAQIALHPVKTHTILIDDVPCFGTEAFDFITQEDVMQKIVEINPDYQFQILWNQVLAATVRPRPKH